MHKLMLFLVLWTGIAAAQENGPEIDSLGDILDYSDSVVANFDEITGYEIFSRTSSIGAPEPRLQYVVAFINVTGLVVGADVYDDVTFDTSEVISTGAGIAEQQFREEHIYPYDGDVLNGGASGSGGSGGSSSGGGSGGGGDSPSGGGSGSSGSGSSGSGSGWTGGGTNYCGAGTEYVCIQIN